MSDIASALQRKLHDPSSVKESTPFLLFELLNFLEEIKKKNKIRNYDDDNIIGQVFNTGHIKDDNALRAFYRCQLNLSISWLKKIIDKLKKPNGNLYYKDIIKYKDHLIYFIFEIKEFVNFFNQKYDSEYEFIRGRYRSHRLGVQFYNAAEKIYFSHKDSKTIKDYVIRLCLSSFLLRQSLELKFRRILGIDEIYNSKFEPLRLKHEFYPEFIHENLSFFSMRYSSMSSLMKIYKWTNYHVHTGMPPKNSEIDFALSYTKDIFKPKKMDKYGRWSIHSAVKISNYSDLLKKLSDKIDSLLKKRRDNSDEIWCIKIEEPEAYIESY